MVVTMNNTAQAVTGEDTVAESFLKSLSLLEQAHRRLHDVVKDDLERGGARHLTGVQALLLYEIGEGETPAAIPRSEADKRTVHLRLTERGHKVRKRVEGLFAKQADALEPTASVRPMDLTQLNKTVSRLERFWSDQIRFRL